MTLTKDIAAKLAVAFVAVAMVFSAFAPSAKAAEQSAEDLQKMINDLLAQVAGLQSQVGQGGTSVASGVCPYTWTRDLSSGAKGADVMKLQQFLNADADTRVAAEGAGSVGAETEFYGPATAAAVSKLQVKYRADILSPAALVNPTGYFGPSSRAKANALCATAPVMDDTTGSTTDDEDTTDEDKTLSGEADLDTYEADDADDDTIDEGSDDAPVAVFTAKFDNGDASISRLDVAFVAAGAQPWKAFETVSLWVDGDKVAEADASSKNDYLGDEADGVIRFSGLDIVAMEDEDLEITVAVTVQNGLDADELAVWTVTTESLRFFDADGVATTDITLVDDESAAFETEEAGTDDDAEVKKNTNNPDASTLLVEDDSKKSEEFDVFLFNIDVDQDSSDLVLGKAYVDIKVSNPAGAAAATTFNEVVSKVYLTIDGEQVTGDVTDLLGDDTGVAPFTSVGEEDYSIAANASNTVRYEFDFDDYDLAADDVYEATLSIVFEGQNAGDYENGVMVEADVDGADWDLEGVEGDNVLTGTQSSKVHTLATVVPDVSDVTSTTDKNDAGDTGTISFQFTVGADGDDVVLAVADNDDVDGTTDDVMFTVTGTDVGIALSALTKVGGDAVYAGGEWTIADGDEATFALDTTLTTASSSDNGTYRVTLDSVGGVDVDKTSAGLALTN